MKLDSVFGRFFRLALPAALVICVTLGAAAGDPSTEAWDRSELMGRYQDTWVRFFGTPPELPDDLDTVAAATPEELLRILWESSRPALDSRNQTACYWALRYKILDDPSRFLDELHWISMRKWFHPSALTGPLMYHFLDETVMDEAFMREVLPPDPAGRKLSAALKERGEAMEDFLVRFQSWVLIHALEAGLQDPKSTEIPAVWGLDQGLAARTFSSIRIPLDEISTWVEGEAVGDLDPRIRLLAVLVKGDGEVVVGTLSALQEGSLILPGGEDSLWIYALNPTAERLSLGGIAITFWGSNEPLFELRSAEIESGSCVLEISERNGMAGYRLWSLGPDPDFERPLSGIFPSEGSGTHHYRILLRSLRDPDAQYRLVGRSLTGAEMRVDFVPWRSVNNQNFSVRKIRSRSPYDSGCVKSINDI